MRILVCGSRGFANHDLVQLALESKLREVVKASATGIFGEHTILHGGAPCVDSLAGKVGEALGFHVEVFKADWVNLGRGAGFLRNQRMLTEGKPDVVLAFWDGESRGTKHMIDLATKAGIPVEVIRL